KLASPALLVAAAIRADLPLAARTSLGLQTAAVDTCLTRERQAVGVRLTTHLARRVVAARARHGQKNDCDTEHAPQPSPVAHRRRLSRHAGAGVRSQANAGVLFHDRGDLREELDALALVVEPLLSRLVVREVPGARVCGEPKLTRRALRVD